MWKSLLFRPSPHTGGKGRRDRPGHAPLLTVPSASDVYSGMDAVRVNDLLMLIGYPKLMSTILTSSTGFSFQTLTFSMPCTTSIPLTHLPKIVCLSSNQGAFSVVTKN